MANRSSTSAQADAFVGTGLQNHPHRDPYWWKTSANELDALLGQDAFPSALESRRLGLKAYEHTDGPAIAVPTYDCADRISGLWAATQVDRTGLGWTWRGIQDVSGGLGLMASANGIVKIWGQSGLIAFSPTAALRLHADRLRNGEVHPPVVLVSDPVTFDPSAAARMLPERAWVVLIPAVINELSAKLFKLARTISAKVRLIPQDTSSFVWSAHWAADQIIGRSASWEERLGQLIEDNQPGFRLASFLQVFGWNAELSHRVSSRWSSDAIARVRDSNVAVETRRVVKLRAGITILDTPGGWIWEEQGTVLAEAVPDQIQAYIGDDSRVWHRGVIRFAGELYKFDTDRFRIEPASVVESTLLMAGVSDRPQFHPAICGMISDIAFYLTRKS